ncbi:ATP-binding cassette-type vacuolar membrane transporter Hmt1 [Vermiconidia calcicola]|uniref:ATP-binding cassette-type vacuolar membrane transporter Hmt1 n=1 Tax=Vermiconidia calcicola TaxID=1690605 RepID=A0ACC3P023_9PEZI|nr:ATP-binding cassette-type vacuolar membrane transporter Hmt1 [Vermiconidia calcicola]
MDLPLHVQTAASGLQTYLQVLRIAYPLILLFVYLIAFTVRSIATARTDNDAEQQTQQLGPGGKPLPRHNHYIKEPPTPDYLDFSRPRKLLFEWLTVGVLFSLAANIVVVIVHALYARKEGWWCGQAMTIYLTGSFMVYALLVIALVDTKPSPTAAHLVAWVVALLMEIMLLGGAFAVYTKAHRESKVGHPWGGKLEREMTEWEITEVIIDIVRIFILGALIAFYALFVFLQGHKLRKDARHEDEQRSLLADSHHGENGSANGHAQGYGTNGKPKGPEVPAGWEKPKETPSRSWWEYIRAYGMFIPYIWPYKNRMLQVNFVICFGIMFVQRAIQVLVPSQLGHITEILSGDKHPVYMPWAAISLYIVYRLFQGSNGLLGAARQVLWIPIEQYSYRELSVAAFEHVHQLSLEFHLGKKTGEVLSALGKGASLNTFLESITFNVLPMLVDLGVAMVVFLYKFDAYYALILAIITFWYIYITIRMASWRADIRRQATNASREEDAVKNDSMMSYETVKYFNAEPYEFNRYQDAVKKYQSAEYQVTFSLALMNTVQNLVFMMGLIVASFLAAFQVTSGTLSVGNFVTLVTYMTQLQGPLNFFGTFYRMIQNNMINSERMLELFKEKPTVVDGPDAEDMPSCEGEIRYNDVHFSYDNRKPALQGLTFRCKPGTTTALVGESGGGKSTVFRLLFRFYNTESGSMQLDGRDVEGVTIDSLRRHVGVVPQDTVLFNETLMYNLKYARQTATNEEIYAACKAASIHDKIMGFPDGYETKVGERGLRLSGGEKQRVAIARTIIKDPRIILLDEATAALDTETEEHIQEALKTLARGRTMLIIAHRLSTITMCDQILVLHEGKVAERGTHAELLAMRGRYAGMWKKQVRAQRAADEAKLLKDKADRLRRESMDSSAMRRSQTTTEDSPPSSDEDETQRQQQQEQQEQSELQGALSLSPQSAVPQAQISSVLGSDSGTDPQAQREAMRSGTVRSPSPVEEEPRKPPGHP